MCESDGGIGMACDRGVLHNMLALKTLMGMLQVWKAADVNARYA